MSKRERKALLWINPGSSAPFYGGSGAEGNGLSHPVNEKSPTGRAFCVGRLGILFPNGESSRLCFLFRGRSINTIFVFDQRKFICGARNDFLLTDYFYAFLPIGIGDGLGGVGDLIGV